MKQHQHLISKTTTTI